MFVTKTVFGRCLLVEVGKSFYFFIIYGGEMGYMRIE
jgi:hypothetical protein